MCADWIILGQGGRLRWGGDLRRHYLLKALGVTTGTRIQPSWNRESLQEALNEHPTGRRLLASVELLDAESLTIARARTTPTLVDLHDEPVRQNAELGHALSSEAKDAFQNLIASNVAAFRYVAVPTLEYAAFAGVDQRQTLVAPNGTDARRIVPGPWPDVPTVGMVSGASPRRGIEALIEACRGLRTELPELRLRLALVGTTIDGRTYLDGLKASVADEPWLTIGTVPYAELSSWLAETTVLVVPHPVGAYFDAVLPIKLFDYFAAGRPIVTTPRVAVAELTTRHGAGLVTGGDAPDDLAAPIGRLLAEPVLARRLGAAGRAAAESTYDWSVIGRRLTADLLSRVDKLRWWRMRGETIGARLLRSAAGKGAPPGPRA
jgi:glycosyltransferase involved in cell wall biosynthesis